MRNHSDNSDTSPDCHDNQRAISFALIGTYDVDNYGDCLFPQLYTRLLSQRLPNASFNYYSPIGHAADISTIRNVRALPARLDNAVLTEDVAILTGGETIGIGHSTGTHAFSLNTLSAFLRLWLAPLYQQRNAGRVFAANCVGSIGLTPEEHRMVGRLLASASFVSFRDKFSAERASFDNHDFQVMVDPMYMISDTYKKNFHLDFTEKLIPDKIRSSQYIACQISDSYLGNIEIWTEQIEKAARSKNKELLLLPICHFLGDAALLRIAQARLASRGVSSIIAGVDANVDVTTAIIAGASGYIGSSLHGAVTAISFGIPVTVIAKSETGKHKGTLGAVGLADRVCTKMSDIAGVFLHAYDNHNPSLRERAHALAIKDFERFLEHILSIDDHAPTSLDEACLRNIVERDVAKAGAGALSTLRRAKARALMLAPKAMMKYRNLRIEARHRIARTAVDEA